MHARVKNSAIAALFIASAIASPAVLAQSATGVQMPGADGQNAGQMMEGQDGMGGTMGAGQNQDGQNGMGMGSAMGGQGGMGGGMGGNQSAMMQTMMQMMMQHMQMMMQNMQSMGDGQGGMGGGMSGSMGGQSGMGGSEAGMGGAQNMWAQDNPDAMKAFVSKMPAEQREMLLDMLTQMDDEPSDD